VNKSELIDVIGNEAGLDKRSAERAVDAFVGTVVKEVKGGNKVTLIGFGTFTPKARAARTARNPRTGEQVKVKASKSVGFSPGSTFKEALNSRSGAKVTGKRTNAAKATAKASRSTKATTKASRPTKTTAKQATTKATKSAGKVTKTAKQAAKQAAKQTARTSQSRATTKAVSRSTAKKR
jgi:DNA-binding protein HU-beta